MGYENRIALTYVLFNCIQSASRLSELYNVRRPTITAVVYNDVNVGVHDNWLCWSYLISACFHPRISKLWPLVGDNLGWYSGL